MFRMSPAVQWLERDYGTLTALEYQAYPELSAYYGLRHFVARGAWATPEGDCIGLMFSVKANDDAGKPMSWRPVIDWEAAERDWAMPLVREVRWL